MNLIICMAGYNTRFHDVGFDIPKYLLPWGKRTVIEEILYRLTEFNCFKNILLVANERDLYFKSKLLKSLKNLNLSNKNLFYIGDTYGQGHTAALSLEFFLKSHNENEPIFFHNADTILTKRKLDLVVKNFDKYEGYVDVFFGKSPKFSYVKVKNNVITQIEEKKIISSLASSGLYAFNKITTYLERYNNFLNLKANKEIFISDIIKFSIKNKGKFAVNKLLKNQETIVLGSPEEYGLEVTRRFTKLD